jgi:hypothetical protein
MPNPAGYILPAVISALICVFFNQSGAFFLFSLVPIAVVGLMFSPLTSWAAVSYSILIFAGTRVIFHFQEYQNPLEILLQTGAFSLLPVFFAWIIAPPSKGPAFFRMRTAFRFVTSSVILFALLVPLIYFLFQQEGFYQSVLADVETALAIIPFAENTSDVVQQSLMKEYFTAENILDSMMFFGLRGCGIFSIMLFFFINRQLSVSITKFFRRNNPVSGHLSGQSVSGLSFFKIRSQFIWAFSVSILILLVSFLVKHEILEIIAWNLFVLCVIMYAAQGMGIVLFFLHRPNVPRGLKIILNLIFIMMIFRFSVMMFFLGTVTVLGILEHWVPFRVSKVNKPSSTPKM